MIEEYVNADYMACLLHRDIRVERIPEPFRMQKDLSLRVTLSEYESFLLSLKNKTNLVLSNNITFLRNLVEIKSPLLYNYFILDVLYAIGKELHYAEEYEKEATVILPVSLEDNTINVSDYVKLYNYFNNYRDSLLSYYRRCGLEVTGNSCISKNEILLKVATVLYAQQQHNSFRGGRISLVYDFK